MADDYRIVRLENVLLRYEALFEARPRDEKKPDDVAFGATVILDNKKFSKVLDGIDDLTDRVALDEFKKKVTLRNRPVKDGNDKSDVEGFGDGVSFISAYRKSRPGVVDREVNPLTKEDGVIYPGCYVNVVMKLFAYDHSTGGKGVSAELVAVQFVADGERFSGGTSADPTKYFSSVEGESSGSSSRSRSSGGAGRSGRGGRATSLDDF